MNEAIRQLEPRSLWNHFADINAIPRGSKKEDKIIEYMAEFGRKLGLETIIDPVRNVIIKKPATPGMENRKTVVLQSHLDMVHQKNNDTDFDFDTQGIEMYIDGDWVTAKGTTLGADNGLGVAAIMSILASGDIRHPAIEALFTIDEETGMTGAQGLQAGYLEGEILLNLDTEDDREIDIGCAGGIDITAEGDYMLEDITGGHFIQIKVKGLHGGHSGMDIDKGYANANKLMNRLLRNTLAHGAKIVSLAGGSLRNAIPRESTAVVWVNGENKEALMEAFRRTAEEIRTEYRKMEPGMLISFDEIPDGAQKAMHEGCQRKFIRAVDAAYNGVYRMSPDIPGLVETSNNIAKISVHDGSITIECLTRSAIESGKMDLAETLRAAFELAGYRVRFSGSYPGWQPNPDSPILGVMTGLYKNMFGEEPNVVACHAGLECGILGQNYPGMDMISFGPTIEGAHSPDERANIASVQKFWDYLLHILENIPEKDKND